ncbi:tRNA adenosine(34) deaminase TadA [Gleimia sp. 6138-11-ORH1]|uniref:tRNA adenosine(34) deaminase TadA n=1 Tax=Gleimia sp. 6138-11-ORH1 TaxID=2973937 RepID=UPI002169DA6B|nr:tRNA adenosine(34) deaminase TadA [Gleimia sp. 6138-11-ORH1]MCS4484988.1 tRNA adenosine(34) deaminase TadA [Gleimia sp. 6138-11-ORH1]
MSFSVKKDYELWMRRAMELAALAEQAGDVPVGALLISEGGEVIASGFNTREAQCDPTGHAEINVLREAAQKLQRWRFSDCTLVVTLEPCTMCAGALVSARVGRVVFGAWDPAFGACGSLRDVVRDPRVNHQVEVYGGVLEVECETQLRRFFLAKR